MYKLSPRVLIGLAAVGLIVLTWGCSSPADSTSVQGDKNPSVSRGNPASSGKTEVKLSIPDSGRVMLMNKEVLRGQISVDSGRQVTVAAGSESKNIPFDALGQVSYAQEANVYRSSGELVIRGDGSKATSAAQDITIGWNDFSVDDKSVRVMLPNKEYAGIIAVAQDSDYVVEEIVFDPQQQKMIIRVRAY